MTAPMPLARKLGEYFKTPLPGEPPSLPKLEPITLKPVRLNPDLWNLEEEQ